MQDHRLGSGILSGWRLVLAVAAALALAAAVTAWSLGGTDGVRLFIRMTARSSFVLFLLAFTASALAHFWPSEGTRWLRANRRYLGLSFAVSHFVHLGAILLLLRMDPVLFHTLTNPVTIISGAIAYVFIAAMALTSFDAAVRAMGAGAWKTLHTMGTWYIFISFAVAYGKRAPGDPFYQGFAAVLLLVLVLKLAHLLSARARARMG
ncbi:MAG: hypothetical protein HXY22_10290 [Alphaproteobacteria bacterium]|nr:hypothetical protein [Alphaproteobacteria bacterium]